MRLIFVRSEATLPRKAFAGNALRINRGSTQHQPASHSSTDRYSV